DKVPEQREVAPEVEDALDVGGQHQVAVLLAAGSILLLLHLAEPAVDVLQQRRRETGPGGPVHVEPADAVSGLVTGSEMPKVPVCAGCFREVMLGRVVHGLTPR